MATQEEMRNFAFYQEITDNFIIQPPGLETSQIFPEFAKLGLPGHLCFYSWQEKQLSLRVSEDPQCERASPEPVEKWDLILALCVVLGNSTKAEKRKTLRPTGKSCHGILIIPLESGHLCIRSAFTALWGARNAVLGKDSFLKRKKIGVKP